MRRELDGFPVVIHPLSHLSDEMNDLDEDVERCVSRDDHLGAFGKERVDDGL